MIKKTNNLLFLENVYQKYNSKIILDDIDLSISDGEFCTLVGPSGSGKSTLLRIILGQELPSSGTVCFLGDPIGFSDTRRGVVYQKYSLFPHLTVLENVMLGKKICLGLWRTRKKLKAIKEEALEFLKRIKLDGHADKYPHELSGGMQQRVAIAQALIMRPKVLLMDEPFGALDPGTRESMQLFILEVWKQAKMTVIFVTHDLEEAVFLGTRLIVLSQYYVDGRGEKAVRGARIVADYQIKEASSIAYKETKDFGKLIAKIRQEGFNPEYNQHTLDFTLSHPDSFHSLSDIEKQRL